MARSENASTLLDAARLLRARINADRDRIETSRRLPADLTQELASGGFFGFNCRRRMAGST